MKGWHCNAHFRDKGTEAQLADQVLNTVRWATLQATCQTRESKRMTLSLELCPWKLPVQWGECLIEREKYVLLRLMIEIRIKWWRARAQRQVILPAFGVGRGRGVDGAKIKEGDVGLNFGG